MLASTSDLLWPLPIPGRHSIRLFRLCLRMLLRLSIRAPGIPVRVLVHLIAGLDVDVGAISLVVRVELRLGLLLMLPVLTPSPPFPALLPPVEALSAIVSEGNDTFLPCGSP